MNATTYPPLGSVSHGTLREEDLIPSFEEVLRQHGVKLKDRPIEVVNLLAGRRVSDRGRERISHYLNETLFDLLDGLAPPYCYFGALEGDGSDFGFWPCPDALRDDDYILYGGPVLKLQAGDDWHQLVDADNEEGVDYILEVTDHGNMTLKLKDGTVLWECA